MSYLALDDCFGEHEKIEPLSNAAFRAHVLALLHCAKNLTDGYVSDMTVKVIAARASATPKKIRDELETYGLWRSVPGGVLVHDYLNHNPTAEQVKKKREDAASRQRRWRDSHRDESGRFTRDETRDETPPPPLHSPKDEVFTPAFTSYEGGNDLDEQDYNHALEQLIDACGGRKQPTVREKLERTLEKYPAPEARLVAICWSVSQPDTRDRLGKALSMLKKEAA